MKVAFKGCSFPVMVLLKNDERLGRHREGAGMATLALVDDDENIVESLKMFFEAEGYKVRTYHDGQTALTALTETPPDLVVLEIERRVLPEEIPSEARADVVDRIRSEYDDPAVEHITPFLESGGLSHQNPDSKCVTESLSSAARLVGYSPQCCAARYGTNASIYASVGIPSVVFGPGSIDQAHTADEWIELKQIDQAISTLVATVANPPTFVGDFNRPK